MNYVILSPAYGRDYNSQAAVKKDWDEDKDFIIDDFFHPDCGRYINKSAALASEPGTTWNIRYSKKTKVLPIRS